ncbi:MAG: D-ribose pyranase [Lachnospiraceae bacterium]|jgi:D-ribose pyranase|nr:D-ribose pyranase [Lachnospiraceae bacterium]
MKKAGMIHGELMKRIALLGHKDLFMIGDAGMPIPQGVEVIDLALCKGVPTFTQVLDAVLEESVVEYYYVAEEIVTANPGIYQYIQEKLPDVAHEKMPHDNLKEFSGKCKFAIRTGEYSPYPNVILRAGVAFS